MLYAGIGYPLDYTLDYRYDDIFRDDDLTGLQKNQCPSQSKRFEPCNEKQNKRF